MDEITRIVYNVLVGGSLLLVALLVVEAFLYYKSWNIIHALKKRIKMSEEKKDYAVEGTLSLVNLALTVILNLILVIILILFAVIILYSIFYLTQYFFIIFTAVLLALVILIYICIKLMRQYNEQGR
jgi:hypothetical protein